MKNIVILWKNNQYLHAKNQIKQVILI